MPDMAVGNKQCASKLTCLFNASKQVVSAVGGSLVPQSVHEAVPGDLIPAAQQPPDCDPIMNATIAATKPAYQVSHFFSICCMDLLLHRMSATM